MTLKKKGGNLPLTVDEKDHHRRNVKVIRYPKAKEEEPFSWLPPKHRRRRRMSRCGDGSKVILGQ